MCVDVRYSVLSNNCIYFYGKVHFNTLIFMHLLICILQDIENVHLCLIGSCVLIPSKGDYPLKGYSSLLQSGLNAYLGFFVQN